jgi:uncharacterized membrane protein
VPIARTTASVAAAETGEAAVAGLTDVLGEAQLRTSTDAWLHAGGNVIVVLIELYN